MRFAPFVFLIAVTFFGCESSPPTPVEPAPTATVPPATAAPSVTSAPVDDKMAARRQAIENARKAGVLGTATDQRAPGGPRAWWNRADACPLGTKLHREESGPWFRYWCVDARGRKQGRYAEWDEGSGRLLEEAHYRDGRLDGVLTQYVEGRKVSEASYRRDVGDGPEIWYDERGEVAVRGQNRRGKRSGVWVEFFPGGAPKVRMHYRDGTEDGVWEFLDPRGMRWARVELDRGHLRTVERWRDGTRVAAAQLLSDDQCRAMIAQARQGRGASGGGDAFDEMMDRSSYIGCRLTTADDVRCAAAAGGSREAIAEKCAPYAARSSSRP